MKNFKTISIVIFIIVILFLFFTQCKSQIIRGLGGYTEKTIETVIDTVEGEVIIDSIGVFNKIVETRGIILNPQPTIRYKYIDTITKRTIDSIKVFKVAIKDSLIDGNIDILNDFKGDLLSANLSYKALFPKYITKTKPIYITKTITETLDNPVRNRIGVSAGINTLAYPSLGLGILTKKNITIDLEYSKPNLFMKEKATIQHDVIGFKIAKYW